MRERAIAVPAAAILGSLALVGAGCGSKQAATLAPPPVETTATEGASHATMKPAAGLLTDTKCQRLYDIAKSFSSALAGDDRELVKTAALLTELAGKTPVDIRPDFRVLAEAYTKIVVGIKGVRASSSSSPSADMLARMAKLSNQIDMAKVGTANIDISAWAARNCRSFVLDTVQH